MKTKILTLFSLLALLLVSTAALSDGRPTGIRIGRLVSGGGTNVEIDVTVAGTDYSWNTVSTTAWLGNAWSSPNPAGYPQFQYASDDYSVPLPPGIDWGDGNTFARPVLFGPPGGPWRGTFAHTYTPGSYTITVGKATCCTSLSAVSANITTGNLVLGYTRYVVWTWQGNRTFYQVYTYLIPLALTTNVTVTTGTGIPTTNVYGLIALALLLVGSGLLLYRKPQRT